MADKKQAASPRSVTELLCEKFKYSDIEFVVVNAFDYDGPNGYVAKAFVIPYIKKESGEQRLDEVLGVENWENDFTFPDPSHRIKYKLRIRIPGTEEWREKVEGATLDTRERGQFSQTAFESALAFAEKRALAKLGVGRYLKLCPEIQVDISTAFRPGWNKYAFKSKVKKGRDNKPAYVKIYWKVPMLPKEFLHDDEKHLADQVDDGGADPSRNRPKAKPKAPGSEKLNRPALAGQWQIIESYYNAFDLTEQEKWIEFLYIEKVDSETGVVTNDRRNISQARAAQIITSLENGYGPLVNGVPSQYDKALPESPKK